MAQERFMYGSSVEALFDKALRRRMTEPCRVALQQAGLDLGQRFAPMYTAAQYERFVRIAREQLFSELADAQAYEAMGRAFLDGYWETILGRAVRGVLKLLGPAQIIRRLPALFAAGSTYVRATVIEDRPGEWKIQITGVGGYPHFTRGLLDSVLEASGARKGRVEIAEILPDERVTYLLRWES